MAEQPYGDAPLFRDLHGDDIEVGDLETTEVESLCMNCHENGVTRILLTKIPFFKDIVIFSFECEHCQFSNNEIQPTGKIQEKGCIITINVKTQEDMSRQVVKSDSAALKIPHLEFEIQSHSQKGMLTTIEGLVSRAVMGLEQDQPVRRVMHPDAAAQIDAFIKKLKNLQPPFELVLDDPSGNSFIENPEAPKPDAALKTEYYTRTREQDEALGLFAQGTMENEAQEEKNQESDEQESQPEVTGTGDAEDLKNEVMSFRVDCSECGKPAETNMKLTSIPYFKEVIIMALVCDSCGYRTNEVKSGAGIEEKGKRLILKMTDPSDLNRDVLKSETCGLRIPELDFELSMGSLGGKFTTIEGLLSDIKDQLTKQNPFALGDSADSSQSTKMKKFLTKFDEIISGKLMITFVLDDPAGNSYIQNVYAPEEDPEMKVEIYERSEEQNDELGISDMKTENYT